MGGRQLRRIGDGCWLHRARARRPSPELLRVGLFRWRGCSRRVDVGVEIGPHEVQTKRALVMRLLLSQGPVESAVTDRRITFRSEKTISQADLPQPAEGDYPDQTDALFGGAGGVPSGVPSLPGSAPLVCPKNFFASLWFCSATGRYGPKVVKLRTDAMARRS